MNNVVKNGEEIPNELEFVWFMYGINLCEGKASGRFEVNLFNPNLKYLISVLYKKRNFFLLNQIK